jgi:hypothetical protein
MRAWTTPLVGAVALAIAAAPIAQVAAAPAAPMQPSVAKTDAGSTVTQVHRRGHGHYGYRRYGHRGRGIGIGLGIGIIGGLIAADAYRSDPAYAADEEVVDVPAADTGDPRVLCAEKFRSFEWKTGLYTTNSGEKKLCPYLK